MMTTEEADRRISALCEHYGVSRARLRELVEEAVALESRHGCTFQQAMKMVALRLVGSAGADVREVFSAEFSSGD